MAACAGVGEALFDNWVNWVLRGHHGEKPENIAPSSGVVSVTIPDTLHCIRCVRNKIQLGLDSYHLNLGSELQAVLQVIQNSIQCPTWIS